MTADEILGSPDVVRDRQGDIWARNEAGRYDCLPTELPGFKGRTLDQIVKQYGPVSLPTWHVTEI